VTKRPETTALAATEEPPVAHLAALRIAILERSLAELAPFRRIIEPPPRLREATLVHAASVDADAQGEPVSVLWEHERLQPVTPSWEPIRHVESGKAWKEDGADTWVPIMTRCRPCLPGVTRESSS